MVALHLQQGAIQAGSQPCPASLLVTSAVSDHVLCVCSCCVEQCPGSQAFVDHLLVDHVDLVNRDLPSWVHAHIYATHLLDFLGEKRHPKVILYPYVIRVITLMAI